MSKRRKKIREMMTSFDESGSYAPSYVTDSGLKGKRPKNKRQRGSKPAYWD